MLLRSPWILEFGILEDSRRDDGNRKGGDDRKLEDIVFVEIVRSKKVTDGRYKAKVFLATDDLLVNIAPPVLG